MLLCLLLLHFLNYNFQIKIFEISLIIIITISFSGPISICVKDSKVGPFFSHSSKPHKATPIFSIIITLPKSKKKQKYTHFKFLSSKKAEYFYITVVCHVCVDMMCICAKRM